MTIFQLGQPSVVIDQVRTGFGLTAQSSRNKGVRGPYPAPAGFRWAYIAENGQVFAEGNQLFVELVRAA